MNFDQQPIYIVDGIRTPFAKMGTAFAETDAVELGRVAVAELLAKTGLDPATIEGGDLRLRCATCRRRQHCPRHRPARGRAGHGERRDGAPQLRVGLRERHAGRREDDGGAGATCSWVGGTENMTLVPLLYSATAARKFTALARAKSMKEKLAVATSFRPEDFKPRVGLQMGLADPVSGLNMGQTAENVARDFNITREEQDKFSLGSHLKAVAAQDKLKEEITPVYLPKVRNGQAYIDEDNGPAQRPDDGGIGQAQAGVRARKRVR